MRHILLVVLIVGLIVPSMTANAQNGDQQSIAYGETADGSLTNQTFEEIYVFEGEADDVVIIEMIQTGDETLDPYLYLTTGDNDILAQNDDTDSLNSRIIYRLPETGIYVIVATRLGERSGTSEGDYRLRLEKARIAGVGEVMEGTYRAEDASDTHVVIVEQDGLYEVVYRHIQGDYYPNLNVQALAADTTYFEDIAQLTGQSIRGGSIMLDMSGDTTYILSFQPNYYTFNDSSAMALYTLQVNLIQAKQEELSRTSNN